MGTTDRDHLLDVLTEGVLALTDSDRWRRHLEVQGRFHRYSFGNALLIGAQCPEATRVAGFTAWRRLGRSVRRGERAIWILAPVVGRRRAARDGADGDGADGDGADGDGADRDGAGRGGAGRGGAGRGGAGTVGAGSRAADRAESGDVRRLVGFRPVPVFDISQTDGDDLPEVCRAVAGDDPAGWFDALSGCAAGLGYSVLRAELPGAVNGDCTFATRTIRVERRNGPAQQVKTLAHELAHALLHEGTADRSLAELEAESTAFVVCRVLGLDTSEYSFGYVACWAGGGEEAVAGIKASCGRIQQAAGLIVAAVEAGPVEGSARASAAA
jgi:hypothetical protein